MRYPPRIQRGKIGDLAIRITRAQSLPSPVTVTLEGYSSGRDKNRAPRPISSSLVVDPVTLEPGQSVAVLKLRATKNAELGKRAVVARVQGVQDGKPVVTYSAPILVEVTK